MLGISQEELCDEAGCGRKLLNDFENGLVSPKDSKVAAIRGALERRGARFLLVPGFVAVAVPSSMAAPRSPRGKGYVRDQDSDGDAN